MRDIKTLLEILLDQYENNRLEGIQWSGLCFAIIRLRIGHVIDQSDEDALLKVIKANRPESAGSLLYWWPKGEVEPRVEFLKQLIKKYETQCQSK